MGQVYLLVFSSALIPSAPLDLSTPGARGLLDGACSWSQFHPVQSLSCVQLCDPMDCSMPGFPVHHQLPELAQTHGHRVSDTIQPSHPLSSPLLLPSIFPCIKGFSNESVLHIRWPKYWTFSFSNSPSNEYSGLISYGLSSLISLQSKGFSSLLQHHSSKASIPW